MIVKIDIRENALIQQMFMLVSTVPHFKNIQIKPEVLSIGDIIVNDGIEDRIIIERKSVSDLLSSIKDGRYEEQSYRLNGQPYHNHNIVYLIEGDVNKGNYFKSLNAVEKQTFYSAMFSLNYYKGFSVCRSFTMEETATIICSMTYKMSKDIKKKPYYKNKTEEIQDTKVVTNDADNGQKNDADSDVNKEEDKEEVKEDKEVKVKEEDKGGEKDYVNVIKKVKKENITPDNIGEIMLCQIPGISSVTAVAIMEKYKSIPLLIKELDANHESLKDLSYTNAKGQVRKINKTSISNIVRFLLKK